MSSGQGLAGTDLSYFSTGLHNIKGVSGVTGLLLHKGIFESGLALAMQIHSSSSVKVHMVNLTGTMP